nr:MAG TPA: Transcription cofactor vestigial-like protein 4 [Caudoviricetes sp.]
MKPSVITCTSANISIMCYSYINGFSIYLPYTT